MTISIISRNDLTTLLLCCVISLLSLNVQAQGSSGEKLTNVSTNDFSFFKEKQGQWEIRGSGSFGLEPTSKSKIANGLGSIVHTESTKTPEQLTSVNEFGDIRIEFNFMLSKGGSIQLYVQGLYGINLNDSWDIEKSSSNIAGSVMQQKTGLSSSLVPARLNACRAPGLWQHIEIVFLAAKFDQQQKKVSNASFARILLNGSVIYENLEVPGASRLSPLSIESATGPIVFSSAGVTAIKDIRYANIADDDLRNLMQPQAGVDIRERPIILNPSAKTIVQRCFIEFDGEKKTYCVAVGSPSGMHYALDLSQGSIINFWKGEFLDATSMWTSRGEYQVARPVGSKIEVRPAPTTALLSNVSDAWPASPGKAFHFKGYRISTEGNPIFMYQENEVMFEDSYLPKAEGNALLRTLKVVKGKINSKSWLRVAGAQTIKSLGDGLFVVGDSQYYVKLSNGRTTKATIRNVAGNQEIVVPSSVLQQDFKYELIW